MISVSFVLGGTIAGLGSRILDIMINIRVNTGGTLMATVILELADDLMSALGDNSSDAAHTMRLAAAFQLCAEGRLSTSKAARLA